jgi:hypothetical protein
MGNVALSVAARTLSARLLDEIDDLAAGMAVKIRAQEPAYRDGGIVPGDELQRVCHGNLHLVLGELAGLHEFDPTAARAVGRQRAEQGLPIDVVLHAFRVGTRHLWEALVERADEEIRAELLLSAADIWAVSDRLALEVTDAYRAAESARTQLDRQVREAVLDSLLLGAREQSHMWDSAQLLRLPQEGRFVVIAAECPGPGQEAVPAAESRLKERNVSSAWRLDAGLQEGVVALQPRFGEQALANAIAAGARGRVGVSKPYRHLDETSQALQEARLAFQTVPPRTIGVASFGHHPLDVFIAGSPIAAEQLARAVLGPILDLAPAERDPLLDTVRTWLAVAGSTKEAAARLHMHRNGVRYRLNRFEELVGRRLAVPTQLAEIHVALQAATILGLSAPPSSSP